MHAVNACKTHLVLLIVLLILVIVIIAPKPFQKPPRSFFQFVAIQLGIARVGRALGPFETGGEARRRAAFFFIDHIVVAVFSDLLHRF